MSLQQPALCMEFTPPAVHGFTVAKLLQCDLDGKTEALMHHELRHVFALVQKLGNMAYHELH